MKTLHVSQAAWTAAFLSVALSAAEPATPDATSVTATFRQGKHPLLIRNDDSPVLQVAVNSPRRGVVLDALTVSLDGTDDLGDIESLRLFTTGDRETFDTTALFGDARAAADEVTFHGHLRLNAGTNVLWLAARMRRNASLDHRVDAACKRIDTTAGSILPRDRTPGIRHRIGVALRRHFDDGVHTYRIPALATTPEGTLLCVYDARRRRARDLQEDIDIGLMRSTDRGQSWEPQRIIMDMGEFGGLPEEQNGCSDPGIVVDPITGNIFVFAVWTWGRPGTHQWRVGGSEPGMAIDKTAQFMMVRSDDDGRTWSRPANLTRALKQENWILFAPSPQQGTALSDGTLIMPVQGRNERDERFSTIMTSHDHGDTWTVKTPYAGNNNECQAAVLGDGSIMLNCRTHASVKFRTVLVSADLGSSWTRHVTDRNTLIEPGCNGSLYRFDRRWNGERSHVLLFANPRSQSGRHHHTIQMSLDDGTTWPLQLLLDEGTGRGYPSLSRIDGEHVGIVYEGSQSDLVFERIALRELERSE